MAAPINLGPGILDDIPDQPNFPDSWRYLVPPKWDQACKHDDVTMGEYSAACVACGLIAIDWDSDEEV